MKMVHRARLVLPVTLHELIEFPLSLALPAATLLLRAPTRARRICLRLGTSPPRRTSCTALPRAWWRRSSSSSWCRWLGSRLFAGQSLLSNSIPSRPRRRRVLSMPRHGRGIIVSVEAIRPCASCARRGIPTRLLRPLSRARLGVSAGLGWPVRRRCCDGAV